MKRGRLHVCSDSMGKLEVDYVEWLLIWLVWGFLVGPELEGCNQIGKLAVR